MAESTQNAETAEITHVAHDLSKRTSVVTIVWKDGDHRLNLLIPFGTTLDALQVEAEKALSQHSENMARMRIDNVEF